MNTILRAIAITFSWMLLVYSDIASSNRSLPMVGPLPLSIPLPEALYKICYYSLCVLWPALILMPRKKLMWILSIAIWVLLIFQDILWLQPFYFTGFVYAAYILFFDRFNPKVQLNTLRSTNVALYFWAGVGKINAGYFSLMVPWLLEPFPFLQKSGLVFWGLGILSILLELGAAILLCSKSFHKFAFGILLLLHGSIFLVFGPWGNGHHTSIFPMNVFQVVVVFVLFVQTTGFGFRDVLRPVTPAGTLIRLIYLAAPILSFFGTWNDLFSFRLYSASVIQANINTDLNGAKLLGPEAEAIWEKNAGAIPVPLWSIRDTGYVFLGESYFKMIYRSICAKSGWPVNSSLVINHSLRYNPGFIPNNRKDEVFSCSEVEK